MVYCAHFRDVNPQMASEVGIKALNIAELSNLGFPVPRGFVIKSRALSDYLLKNKLVEPINNILENVDIDNYASLNDAHKKITDLIMAGSMPDGLSGEIGSAYKNFCVSEDMKGLNDAAKSMINAGRSDAYVAVRSSAVTGDMKSCASGLHASLLNVMGTPALLKSVLKCFSSFYSPPAIYYYRKNNVRSPELAIIVQEMVVSEKSGVLYTANPATNNLNEFVIEGSYGLGESVARGEVTPDRYVLNVQSGTITEAKVSKKASMVIIDQLNGGVRKERVASEEADTSILSNNEIKVIAEIADKIQVHFNHPQDIEWAIAKRRAYVLQSVPINIIPSEQEQAPDANESGNAICCGTGTNICSSVDGEIRVINSPFELGNINSNNIVVAPTASVDLLPVLKSVRGVITNNGGMLSSLAKISREMNVPMIVGVCDATTKLSEGMNVSMDCRSGNIYGRAEALESEHRNGEGDTAAADSFEDEETIIATKIKLNVLSEADCENMKDASDGIGFMSFTSNLSVEAAGNMNGQTGPEGEGPVDSRSASTLKVIDSFYPKSVWVKTKEMHDPDFKNQLNELKMIVDKGYNNIGIMLPGVHHQSFIEKVKEMATETGLNLSSIEYGISVDTPAACMMTEELSNTGIKFMSIDYEKIIRNTLGLSPDTKITNHEMHPAVLKIIKNCIRDYHGHKIHTSIHGKGIVNQSFVEKLIEFHIDSISVNRSEFKMLKYVAARTEKKMLLDIMMHRS